MTYVTGKPSARPGGAFRYCHDSRAERLPTATAPLQPSTRIAALKPDDTPHDTGEKARQRTAAHSAPARQRNCGRHHSHGKARSTRGNAPGSGNTTRRTAHCLTHAARTAQTHHATGTTPRTRKHERNTVLLAASRIHGHCALPGRDLISTTIRNKGDGLCPRRWRPKEPMLS